MPCVTCDNRRVRPTLFGGSILAYPPCLSVWAVPRYD